MTAQRTSAAPARSSGTISLGDLRVHRLGYGAIQLTGRGTWGDPPDRAGAIAVLRRAVELGVDFIDTAEAYGPFTNEELIRDALHPYDGVVIATKGGGVRPGPGQWEAVGRPGFIRQGVETSLRRLGVERLELYQLHRIDPHVPLADTLGTIADLQAAGKIGQVGLSEVDVDEIEAAREIVQIVSVQNHYNLTRRRWDHVVDYCEREGIAFIPWAPLGSGQLSELDALTRIDGLTDRTASQIALAWLLHRSPAMLPIPGTGNLSRLEQNVHAAGLHLDAEQYQRVGAHGLHA